MFLLCQPPWTIDKHAVKIKIVPQIWPNYIKGAKMINLSGNLSNASLNCPIVPCLRCYLVCSSLLFWIFECVVQEFKPLTGIMTVMKQCHPSLVMGDIASLLFTTTTIVCPAHCTLSLQPPPHISNPTRHVVRSSIHTGMWIVRRRGLNWCVNTKNNTLTTP